MVQYLGDGAPEGTTLGRSDDLVSFFGATPVVQRTYVADATNTTTTTSTTTALTTDLDSVRGKLNSVLAALRNLGLMASA